ncbi:MAG: polyphenol oxidase, partial [Alphaproteobacteria bacterium]|nr:polyphenol oxidase [Alphaproteobacteria bacterium]
MSALTPHTHAALDGLAHGFFPRKGGVSDGIYQSLNIGLGSDDAR